MVHTWRNRRYLPLDLIAIDGHNHLSWASTEDAVHPQEYSAVAGLRLVLIDHHAADLHVVAAALAPELAHVASSFRMIILSHPDGAGTPEIDRRFPQ